MTYTLMEIVSLISAVGGVAISAVLTTDSAIRYLRIRPLLPPDNLFPLMHLRNDLCLLLMQIGLSMLSLVWFSHLTAQTPHVEEALDDLWIIFPIRFVLVLLALLTQARNALDRYRMDTVAVFLPKESADVPPG